MGKSGSRDGNDSGKRTAQKHRFYKFSGSGNNSKSERKDDQSTGEKDRPKVFPLDKYREKPLVSLEFQWRHRGETN